MIILHPAMRTILVEILQWHLLRLIQCEQVAVGACMAPQTYQVSPTIRNMQSGKSAFNIPDVSQMTHRLGRAQSIGLLQLVLDAPEHKLRNSTHVSADMYE